MKLINAHLCLDCEEVYEWSKEVPNQRECPSCGNKASFAIARVVKPMAMFEREQSEHTVVVTESVSESEAI